MKKKFFLHKILLSLAVTTFFVSCTRNLTSPEPSLPTGIDYVDAVIKAGLSGDSEGLKGLFVLSTVPCTNEKWLFMQPLCAEGEEEGTLVQTMPLLSSDLGHLRCDELKCLHGLGDVLLYAVYKTGSYTYSSEYFPAGDYAVVFIQKEYPFVYILQVIPEGIVRIDYCAIHIDICSGLTIDEILKEHPSAFILGPFPSNELVTPLMP